MLSAGEDTTTHLHQESSSNNIDFPTKEDDPALVKLLVQYLYEADYNPLLPPGTDHLIPPPGRLVADADDLDYTYEFPHSCDQSGKRCAKKTICPHHTCSKAEGGCKFACDRFICFSCNGVGNPPEGEGSQLEIHLGMWALGDKYEVRGLPELARDKFERACAYYWDTAEFLDVAELIVDSDGKFMLDVIVKTVAGHLGLAINERIKALLGDGNGLALEVLQAKMQDGWH